MDDSPQTWHYGLVARYWAEHLTGGPEIAYFQRLIEQNGQPALDAGCGTGRLLVPFLKAGLDVDGCDVSADMLALCRKRAEQEGFEPALDRQALHALDLPRRYQSIVVCGALGIGVTRRQDELALQRFYQHLNPGGALFLDHHLPYIDAEDWQLWLKEGRANLPEPWPKEIGNEPPNDGSDYELYSRVVAFDPLAQQIQRQMRTLLWKDGRVVADEEYLLTENLYFSNELQQMLEKVGFEIEAIQGDYREEDAAPGNDVIVFIARK